MKRPWLDANGNTFPYRKLVHVASLKARIGWQSLRTDEFLDEGPYCVTGTDFQNGKINWSTAYHVNTERYEMDENIQLNEGDLLVTKDGTIGKVAVVHGLDAPATLNSGVFVVRPKTNELSTDFLGWVVRSKVFDDFVAFNFSGSTINHLYQNVFETFRFPFPDLATQRQIDDFLDHETARIDLLIEKKQRLVALLGEKTAETIRQCVSLGMDPNVRKKPSRVPAADDLAAHWSEQRLSTICRFVQGKAHEPFIEDDGKYICVTARFVSTNGEKSRRCTKNLTPGKVNDMAMVMSDLPNGRALARAFLIDENDLYAINQRVCAITVMEGDSRFFYFQLNRNLQLMRYNDGFNQTHLPNRAFTQLFLKVPPVEEQTRIADHLDAVMQKTKALTEKTNASITRLKEYRSALITAAVTGQIDVATYTNSGTPDRRLDAIQEEMGA